MVARRSRRSGLLRRSAKSCAPAGSACSRRSKALTARVRIAGARERQKQRRRDLRQAFARRGRAHRRKAPEVPAAHRLRHVLRRLEAEPAQGLDRLRVVLAAGEDQIAHLGGKFAPAFEEPRIAFRNCLQHVAEPRLERIDIGLAHEPADPCQPVAVARHGVRLLVAHHLQPVLDHAQEDIRLVQLRTYRFVDPALLGERSQHFARARAAKRRVAPTGDQLLRLHEELDLADAAAPALDVVAGDGDRAMPAMRVHLALDRMDVGDRREVEVPAPDERRATRG